MRKVFGILVMITSMALSGCASWKVSDEYKETLKALFVSDFACNTVSRKLHKELTTVPIYYKEGEACGLINLHDAHTGEFYTDDQCSGDSFPYQKTDYRDFCKELITPYHDRLGNPNSWVGDPSQYWTLPPSAGLSLSTLKIRHNHYPLMTRASYKSVPVRQHHQQVDDPEKEVITLQGMGQCDLEMRIYKRTPTETTLKPLMVIHGGAWRFRGSAFAAFESELSHLTERGFVVFAPFYRLVSQADANYECNQASWQSIVSDIEDAMSWVMANGERYGARPGKLYLLGGSAGGHLASWLTVKRPEDIARTLLFYPPTDFRHYVQQAQKSTSRLKGEGYMKGYLGVEDLDTLSLDDEAVVANSFTSAVEANPQAYPPIAMIHGLSDGLVPSDQSVRLCNAKNGDIEGGPARNEGGDTSQGEYSKRYQCGEQGMLYIINEGDHGLDVCVEEVECPAGGEQSQQAVKQAMRSVFDWLAE